MSGFSTDNEMTEADCASRRGAFVPSTAGCSVCDAATATKALTGKKGSKGKIQIKLLHFKWSDTTGAAGADVFHFSALQYVIAEVFACLTELCFCAGNVLHPLRRSDSWKQSHACCLRISIAASTTWPNDD